MRSYILFSVDKNVRYDRLGGDIVLIKPSTNLVTTIVFISVLQNNSVLFASENVSLDTSLQFLTFIKEINIDIGSLATLLL